MKKECMICKNSYDYCPDCERTNSYKAIVDTPICYGIYLIVIEHRDKVIDTEKALNKLKEIGVTKQNIDTFSLRDNIKKRIADIFSLEVEPVQVNFKSKKRKR